MSFLDIVLLAVLAWSFISGLINGFFYKLGSLVGFVIGIVIAGSLYDDFSRIFGGSTTAGVIAFIALYFIISKLIAILFKILNKFFKFVDKIPFIKQFNKLLGGILGLFTTILVLSLVLFFLTKFELITGWAVYINDSWMAYGLIWIGGGLSFLLPNAVAKMKSFI